MVKGAAHKGLASWPGGAQFQFSAWEVGWAARGEALAVLNGVAVP